MTRPATVVVAQRMLSPWFCRMVGGCVVASLRNCQFWPNSEPSPVAPVRAVAPPESELRVSLDVTVSKVPTL